MSEDEATEKLKELVIRCKECKFATCENCEINWKEVQAIETILDLYKQEKEKNKILKDELNSKINALDRAMSNPDYICKDKIRELLKVIQKEKDIATKNILEKDYNLAENGAICQELGYIEGKLKELLEED